MRRSAARLARPEAEGRGWRRPASPQASGLRELECFSRVCSTRSGCSSRGRRGWRRNQWIYRRVSLAPPLKPVGCMSGVFPYSADLNDRTGVAKLNAFFRASDPARSITSASYSRACSRSFTPTVCRNYERLTDTPASTSASHAPARTSGICHRRPRVQSQSNPLGLSSRSTSRRCAVRSVPHHFARWVDRSEYGDSSTFPRFRE